MTSFNAHPNVRCFFSFPFLYISLVWDGLVVDCYYLDDTMTLHTYALFRLDFSASLSCMSTCDLCSPFH